MQKSQGKWTSFLSPVLERQWESLAFEETVFGECEFLGFGFWGDKFRLAK